MFLVNSYIDKRQAERYHLGTRLRTHLLFHGSFVPVSKTSDVVQQKKNRKEDAEKDRKTGGVFGTDKKEGGL